MAAIPCPRCSLTTTAAWNSSLRAVGKTDSGLKSSMVQRFSPLVMLRRTNGRQNFILDISALTSNDFKTGTNIVVDGAPWRVQEFLHVKPGKGAAFVRTKLRNYITGNTVEKTFRAGEGLEEAYVEKNIRQHTYIDGDQLVFMDMETFEESRLNKADIGERVKFLKEGMECSVMTWNNKVLDVELPITVKFKVIESEPGVKGDTSGSGGTKPCKIDTGATIQVPLFVNQDDEIMVDTRTGTYMSRA